jgi:small subunit ribosomal protein S9
MVKKEKPKIVFTVGKRKRAVARAKIVQGKGRVLINSKPLDVWGNETLRLWVKEPLLLAGDLPKLVDIEVNVKSGGITGQAEAVRQAIARGLVEFFKSKELRDKYLEYDRNLLVYDYRRTEPHKPSRSKAGPRRHKQRSKR